MSNEVNAKEVTVNIEMSVKDARKLVLTLESCFKNEESYSNDEMAALENLYDLLMCPRGI